MRRLVFDLVTSERDVGDAWLKFTARVGVFARVVIACSLNMLLARVAMLEIAPLSPVFYPALLGIFLFSSPTISCPSTSAKKHRQKHASCCCVG